MAESKVTKATKTKDVILSKIAGPTLGFSKAVIRKLVDGQTDPVALYTVGGLVMKVENGTSAMGDYVRFIGDFYATLDCEFEGSKSRETLCRSSKCFLPKLFESTLEAKAIEKSNDKGKITEPVKFSIQVLAIADDKSAAGYVFAVEPLVKLTSSNQLDSIIAEANAAKK